MESEWCYPDIIEDLPYGEALDHLTTPCLGTCPTRWLKNAPRHSLMAIPRTIILRTCRFPRTRTVTAPILSTHMKLYRARWQPPLKSATSGYLYYHPPTSAAYFATPREN